MPCWNSKIDVIDNSVDILKRVLQFYVILLFSMKKSKGENNIYLVQNPGNCCSIR